MKTTADQATRDELIKRINTLNENSKAVWGRMNVYQMVRHCAKWEEMSLGKKKYKQAFIGRLFGKMALKSMLKDDAPMKQNLPTAPGFKMTDNGDIAAAKAQWVALMQEHANSTNTEVYHPFFGRLTKEQAGCMAYKHIDHHLRQFNS